MKILFFCGPGNLSKAKQQLQAENAELKSFLSVPVVNVTPMRLNSTATRLFRKSKKRKREVTSAAGSNVVGGPSVEAVLMNQNKRTKVKVEKVQNELEEAKDDLEETQDTLNHVILSENNKMTEIDKLKAQLRAARQTINELQR